MTGFAAGAGTVAHVFVPDISGDDDLVIAGADGHHLQRVRRLRPDEGVTASDGCGAWRVYRVRTAEDGKVVLGPDGTVTREPELAPRLTIAFAPAKGDQAGAVAHQLVELGVDGIMPVTLARSVVRREGDRAERALARLRRVVREAATQCRRAHLPEVLAPESLDRLAGHPGLVVADPGGQPAAALAPPAGGEWLVLVGPEGGFDPSERALVAAAPRLAVGPHVLRAVTAPVAAAAAIAGFRGPAEAESTDSRALGPGRGTAERAL